MKHSVSHAVERGSDWLERYQIPLYAIALVGGVFFGSGVPSGAANLEHFIDPLLIALIYATFIAVPFTQIAAGFRDARYLTSIVVLNFLCAPLVAGGLGRLLFDDPRFLIPIVLVLCAPCVDYVMVFSRLAGGTWVKTLAAAPVLLLVQMVLLPVYVWLIVPGHGGASFTAGPFLRAFGLFIVLPLVLALVTRRFMSVVMAFLMVPLMMGTLFVVVGSQWALVLAHRGELVRVVPLYVLFALVMVVIAEALTRWRGHDMRERRALVFSAVTRNSLVVLPFALALRVVSPLAPVIVVTQTLVELVIMVVLVWAYSVRRRPDTLGQ